MAFKQRVVTAAVLIPGILLAVSFMTPLMFTVLISGVVVLAAWEWSGLSGIRQLGLRSLYVISVLLILYLVERYLSVEVVLCVALTWWVVGGVFIVMYEAHIIAIKLSDSIKLLIGLLILVPACWSMIQLRGDGDDISWVLFLLLLIWVTDTVAYFSGKRWGRRRLALRVSPGKSWEGVLVSLVAVVFLALLARVWLPANQVSTVWFVFLCLVTAGFSVLGDLTESLVKRSSGVKDSGGLLPGHGGIMDRIDSLTAAAPVFLAGFLLMEKFR